MGTATFDLARLLAPTDAHTFLHDHWEAQPLVLHRGDRGYYADLFSAADIDHVIAFTRPQFPGPGGALGPQAAKTFVQGGLPDRPPAPPVHYPGVADLRHTFAAGKTVVVRSMQNRWPAVAALCRALEGAFQCPVHTNLYLTPPRSQGFEPHIDTHEVFALQIDGAKTWRLYGSAADRPLADAPTGVRRSELGPPREVRLEPGDLLYLPRGYAHEALTTTDPSLHLTVGVNVYRWLDLMHEALVAAAQRDARLRASIPPGALLSSALPNDVTRTFQELLRSLADTAEAGDAVQRLAARFFDGLDPLPDGYFTFQGADEPMGLETVLVKRPGALCRVFAAGDTALIEFPGGRFGGPLRIAPALRFFAATDRFAVRDVPEMSADARLVLARRAVREGLFAVAANHAAPADGAGATRRPVGSGA